MIQHPTGSASSPPPIPVPSRLIDNHGRIITYLRLSITDRCNLRCRYCRPASGIPFIPHDQILTFEELERLASLFIGLGVTKIRVTGGEPFSRRGCMPFLRRLRSLEGLKSLHITTNGVKTSRYIEDLASLGIDGMNLSLDTLDKKKFWSITRRDYIDSVLLTLYSALEHGIFLKINSVILADTKDSEIMQMSLLAQKFPIHLRFIERMPFSGTQRPSTITENDLALRLKKLFPSMRPISTQEPSTARMYSLPGYQGSIGIIQGFSRLFCSTCNKVRITPNGMLKTCLYDNGAMNLKELLRQGASDRELSSAIAKQIQTRFADGHEAEQAFNQASEQSMAKIGG